jgi:hypothetical protein
MSRVFNLGFQIIFFHEIISITEATMESTLLEVIQRGEVMTTHWECKILFKEKKDGPYNDVHLI